MEGLIRVSLLYKIGSRPVIAAVRDLDQIHAAMGAGVDNLFFMGGNIKDIIRAVRVAKEACVGAFVHLDLVRGLSSTDKESVAFIADYVGATGIVTPKAHLIKEAKRLGLYGVLHLFVLDSHALESGIKAVEATEPDAIELMPGLIEKVIQRFAEVSDTIPIIASGLIQTKEEVASTLQAGATSVSVSNPALWSLTFADLQV